ncbi:hypothetical protein CDS [Bradyrhizobium sp.]|nr:hypothetical protein CDS [Bradyrhizobium sp.]
MPHLHERTKITDAKGEKSGHNSHKPDRLAENHSDSQTKQTDDHP